MTAPVGQAGAASGMETCPSPPEDRDRLSKLLAMFSSTPSTAKIVNAARAAERLVKARGETWETIIVNGGTHTAQGEGRGAAPPREGPGEPPRKPRSYRSDFQDEIDACIAKGNLLTPWEREFLTSISDRMSLSEKQRGILDRIKTKLSRYVKAWTGDGGRMSTPYHADVG